MEIRIGVGRWRFDDGEFVTWKQNGLLHLGGVGQAAVDLLAHADPLPDSVVTRTSRVGERLLRALDQGGSGVDLVDFDPSLPEEVWAREMPREWQREVDGRLTRIEPAGVARIRASGNLRSYFSVTVEGREEKMLTVVFDGSTVLGVEGGEPAAVVTCLAPSRENEWVGWRPTVRKTLTVRVLAEGAGDEIVVSDGAREVRAIRIPR